MNSSHSTGLSHFYFTVFHCTLKVGTIFSSHDKIRSIEPQNLNISTFLYITADLYNVNIQDIGLISGIPIIAGYVGDLVASFLADLLRNHTSFEKANVSGPCC